MRVYNLENSPTKEVDDGVELCRFSVLYAKTTTKKHKTWEGDGILICYTKYAVLKDENEKNVISRSTGIKRIDELEEGFNLKMGGLIVQIQQKLDRVVKARREIAQPVQVSKPVSSSSNLSERTDLKRSADPSNQTPLAKRLSKGFVCPVRSNSSGDGKNKGQTLSIGGSFERHLRQHQKDGVKFIYEKLKNAPGGVILADDVGLGKSVQTLASIYALMGNKPNSTTGVRNCLLVVPSSLVNNWKAEFKKWFNQFRIPVTVVRQAGDIRAFSVAFRHSPFLLISYDMVMRLKKELSEIHFDVLVCDEGHRLKNFTGKLRKCLNELNIGRRLLLTGTPIQNDLDELYSLLDFTRPGIFGTPAEFKKIVNKEEKDHELNKIMEETLLRRTGEIQSHLPTKNEYVIFCRQSTIQKDVYTKICDFMTGKPLVLIDFMRKLANHPGLLAKKLVEKCQEDKSLWSLLTAFPSDYIERSITIRDSGKLSVLSEMLSKFLRLGECTVVVSGYTKNLDMIGSLCGSLGMDVLRLDGQTPAVNRQAMVNKFNNERNPKIVFLLSTRAGGAGFNLVAASRLILFDSEWNPAFDLQAMGRIWRDGQTRECHIFRLCTTGSIDEKILQRQIKKTSLSSVLGVNFEASGSVNFTDEDLRDIFSPCDSSCNTHDLLECNCEGSGALPSEMEENNQENEPVESTDEDSFDNEVEKIDVAEESAKETEELTGPASMSELFRWRHYSPLNETSWNTFLYTSGLEPSPSITFAFHLTSQF